MTEQGQNGVERLEDWLLLRSAFHVGRLFLEQLRRRRNAAVTGLFESIQRVFLLGVSGRDFPYRNQADEARFKEARYCPLCAQKITTHLGDVENQMEDEDDMKFTFSNLGRRRCSPNPARPCATLLYPQTCPHVDTQIHNPYDSHNH